MVVYILTAAVLFGVLLAVRARYEQRIYQLATRAIAPYVSRFYNKHMSDNDR